MNFDAGVEMRKGSAPFWYKKRHWPKPSSLPRQLKLRSKLFLSFAKELLSCSRRTAAGKVGTISASFSLRLPAVEFFETVCRGKTQWCRIVAARVRFSEQNQVQRLFATDQFCKSLAVISRLDVPFRKIGFGHPGCCLLLASSPEAHPKRITTGRIALGQPQAVQGFVVGGACGEVR